MTGTVRGHEIKTNRDGTQAVLILKVEMASPDDVQSVQYMSSPGDNTVPPAGSVVTVIEAGPAWKIAVASDDGIDFDSSVEAGERLLYSSDAGTLQAFIKLLKSGIIHLNGDADSAVAYTDLNTALGLFITDLNTKLSAALTGVGGSWPGTSLDISAAEVAEVKLP